MRQLGTLPDGHDARTLADYLAGLSIETRLLQSAGGWELWVCDEDKVARAREEYQAFQANPADKRFRNGSKAARRAEDARDEEAVVGRRATSPPSRNDS